MPSTRELASKIVRDPIALSEATVQSDRESIRCFFLFKISDFEGPFGEISEPFTPIQPLEAPLYERVEPYRVYYYNGTLDDTNDDTFTLFIQNAYNQSGWVRLRVPAGGNNSSSEATASAVLDLINDPLFAELRRDVHSVTLIGTPSQKYKSFGLTSGPFCRVYFGPNVYEGLNSRVR